MAAARWRSAFAAAAPLIIAAACGGAVAWLIGEPLPGVAFGLGLLIGGAASIFLVPALRGAAFGLDGAAIDDSEAGWAEFHREFARARRFDGQFALVRIPLDGVASGERTALRDQVAGTARRIDRVWEDDGSLLVLMPESSDVAVEALIARLRDASPTLATADPVTALFPQHGITSGVLIATVYGGGQHDVPVPIGAMRPADGMPAVDDGRVVQHG